MAMNGRTTPCILHSSMLMLYMSVLLCKKIKNNINDK